MPRPAPPGPISSIPRWATSRETHFGWVAGGGVERAFTPNVTGRIEYLYYAFDGVDAPAGAVAPGTANLEPTVQTLRFGFNFKF